MLRLSDESAETVRRLYELSGSQSWFGRARRERTIISLLEQLTTTGEPGALPCVTGCLLATSSEIRQAARHAAASIFSGLSPYELVHISDHFGWSYGWYVAEAWEKLSPSDVAVIAGERTEVGHSAILGLLSFHRNGFVRHEAIRRLANVWDGSELPCLLIRQNDWVHQVAHDAQAAVVERIKEAYLPHLVRSLRLILHLDLFSRYDHSGIVHKTIDILLDERHDNVLRSAIMSPDREVRRQVVRYGLEKRGAHQARLVPVGLESNDPIIRLMCCRCVPSVCEHSQKSTILNRLRSDLFTPVRREALRITAEQFPDTATETWEQGLLDRSRSIRELARFTLTKLGRTGVPGFYRRALAEHPDSLPVLEGLAEAGDTCDADFFRELLHHSLPSRRRVAVQGLIRICKDAALKDIKPLLKDDSPSVIREVTEAISLHRDKLTGEELVSVALSAQTILARRNAVNLLLELSKWPSIPWLLHVVTEAEPETAAYAEQSIQQWFLPPACNRVFIRPTEREKQDITAALERSSGRVSTKTADLIENGLRQFG